MILIDVAEGGSSFVLAHKHLHSTHPYMLNERPSIICDKK